MTSRKIPEIFTIESLRLRDEDDASQEGQLLSKILHLSGKKRTKYFYIRTKRELEEIIDIFEDSNYRYLHLSCHADKAGIATTFDDISYAELGEMLRPCLEDRRVFVSACQMANDVCAKALLKNTGCYSLVGPVKKINFDDAAAFWITFYHLMFKTDGRSMKHRNVEFYVKNYRLCFKNQ
ncbi:hypothetical protein LCM4577_26760 [Mesorhizobium sp. LCM 4577]|uniref:hypothetical protein n=1 Tax=Mesorhizobium sp. LCM 4577 TaxID=1848288 RepID=UPI0008D93ABB|nr:hypothetical protein [Mesorhizobium sp. LCM 4577]OHV67157.1 hypothetical protein LCM4577_26760 [Mesorhizobium sp. LCM 4577]